MGLAAVFLSGCAGFPGGAVSIDTFSLSEPPVVQSVASAPNRQILITEPTTLRLLDSDRIVVRTSALAVQYLADAQWNDRLPRLVQAKLVEAFENTGGLGGVGRAGDGLAIDYQIVSTIRTFEVVAYGAPAANVELSVKVLNDRNGVVRAQRVFTGAAPLVGAGNEAYVQALEAALNGIIVELVPWVMRTI